LTWRQRIEFGWAAIGRSFTPTPCNSLKVQSLEITTKKNIRTPGQGSEVIAGIVSRYRPAPGPCAASLLVERKTFHSIAEFGGGRLEITLQIPHCSATEFKIVRIARPKEISSLDVPPARAARRALLSCGGCGSILRSDPKTADQNSFLVAFNKINRRGSTVPHRE
jgi:hypothetical protein